MHNRPISLLLVIAMLSVLLFVGCGDTPSNATLPKPIGDLTIPNDFNFRTTEFILVTHDFGDNFPNVPIAIYGSAYDSFTENQSIKDFAVGSGTTDGDGKLSTKVTVPLSCTYLVLKPSYIGLPEEVRISIEAAEKTVSRAYTSKNIDIEYTFTSDNFPNITLGYPIQLGDTYWWFVNDDYPSDGIPKSLFSISLEKNFLKDLNNSLFRWNKNADEAPQELTDGLTVGTLDMSAENDVWMTFIDEKAGFYNTLGYYIYPTANKPTSIGVDDITLVFPNASYGNVDKKYLESGDTVYIGKIAAGDSIGFVLIANGWSNASGQVRKKGYQDIYYSQAELNPAGEAHASIVYYGDKVFLIGMEDNTHTATDYNFRDMVFAIVVGDEALVQNPIGSHAIATDFDQDDDGVVDALDAFPDDGSRTTTETLTGTLAYEDMWPNLGDYDFNDLVIGYEYAIDGNADNQIVSMKLKYTIVASGAGYPNGFALTLPLFTSDFTVSDLSYSNSDIDPMGSDFTVISEGEGIERSQILIFKRPASVMGVYPSTLFNTGNNTELDPQSISFNLEFTSPISRDILGSVPYDVFMLVDNATGYGREVHFIGYVPTSLANQTFLDEANTLENKEYYKSEHNLPWAIQIPGDWEYPLERKSIVDGYYYFGAWAESGGTRYPDWYLDKPNYKNTSNLY